MQLNVFWGYSYGKPLPSNCLIFDPNFSVTSSEIEYRHFLSKQNPIWQLNHTVLNSSIWTTNSQSLSVFKILKFAAQFFIFLDTHSLVFEPKLTWYFTGKFLFVSKFIYNRTHASVEGKNWFKVQPMGVNKLSNIIKDTTQAKRRDFQKKQTTVVTKA